MTDEQHAGARLLQSGHGGHALGLKVHVAHRQRLIHDHDVRLGNDVHRERQAHIHPARIGLDRLLDEVADVGKGGNVIEACRRFLGAQAQQGATQADIFTAGEVGVEARAQLQQRGDPTIRLDAAAARVERAADQLQQGRFAAARTAEDADRLPLADLE